MKRALIITGCLAVALVLGGWLARPHIATVLAERNAAKNRTANHLSEDALHALVSDPALTLFSIDPHPGAADLSSLSTFQGRVVLGQATVAALEQRQRLADVLRQGLSNWSGSHVISCFNPRHAIRATDGSRTHDFLICFECGRLYYYPPNSERRQLQIRTKAGPFNEILAAANIPIPQEPQNQ